MLEVPDEGINELRDFIDIDINTSQNKEAPNQTSAQSSTRKAAIKRKLPTQNPKTPG